MKKLLIFTGGGIAPALNPTIVGVVRAAHTGGMDVYGGRNGWASLLPESATPVALTELSDVTLDLVDQTGGSILGTSRTNPFAQDEQAQRMLENAKAYDGIIAVGGDDTLGAARKAAEQGVPIVGIPKTIDNDLGATYFSPGFPTAADTLARFTKAVVITAQARGKVHVIETLGGKAGWLTCAASVGGAQLILPPEFTFSLPSIITLARERFLRDGYLVIAVSHYVQLGLTAGYEVATDSFGLGRPYLVSLELRKAIEAAVNVETKVEVPGNALSGADPNQMDRMMAHRLAERAVRCLAEGQHGVMATITPALDVSVCTLADAVGQYRAMDNTFFDQVTGTPRERYGDYIESLIGRRSDPSVIV